MKIENTKAPVAGNVHSNRPSFTPQKTQGSDSSTRHASIHVSSIRGLVTNQDVNLLTGWNCVPQNFDFITEEIFVFT
jgi:hypothetical protein